MSTTSRQSYTPGRRVRSGSSRATASRSRPFSRVFNVTVDHEEARSYALRTAYLHYLLQPKAKRKQYVPAPKPAARSHTSVGQLIQEYGSGSSSSLKLPHNFATPLLDRVGGVIRGGERLPGFNDPAVKRSFAEAYTAFSDKNFRKTIDSERKIEPLVLIFYSSATKAAQKGSAPGDDSWKLLPDRHLALFIRLAATILREQGQESNRLELLSRLKTLENKLLTNDQNLVGNGSDGAGTTIEVIVPLSHDVKDMPMVQDVARIFGLALSDVQNEINENRATWNEKAALKDLKAYQLRLNAGSGGALRSTDFEKEEAFEDWKKSEAPHLSQMMMDILLANPELSKTSTGSDVPPLRPQSVMDDQAYAELGKALASGDDESIGSFGFDASLGLGALSMSDGSSVRAVEDVGYTFIPPDARAFLKYIVQQAMSYDQIHADPQNDYQPLSQQSINLVTELCVRWRVPQSSRLIVLLEVAARKFLDREIVPEELDTVFDTIKTPLPESKKAPHMSNPTASLPEIPSSHWTLHDVYTYQNVMERLHDSLLRELYDLMDQCYDTKPPNIGAVMFILENHINADQLFSPKTAALDEFANQLMQSLRSKAAEVYRKYMEKEIPAHKEDWEFGHVVKLGKDVIKLCDRIRKRYKNTPEIMGVDPLSILVQEVFPSFEGDAGHIIQSILENSNTEESAIAIEDGFDLYRELVEIRKIHQENLPHVKFAFDVENLLIDFVWRWIHTTSSRMTELVDGAIKQDQFQVRTVDPMDIPLDDQRHSVSIIDMFMLFNQTVDQVCKLAWDKDEHHARFMTALAGSFSEGIGRYCETVESRFTKEMDRLSAEEVAAQNMSAQEKWMQYAKDAWMSKEKPEPFHFYPESFVKLNNIEYAMQELDRLEKSMNVDACAAIMDRIDEQKRKVRKPNKYTFTVKIVEAEDLKACDANGLSDPYIVFGDEYQKRLFKTRIVYRNLNPRWDESFDVTVQNSVNVIATVWDFDTFGDHDFVGRTSLKLDPLHFSDYLPREFWLDLDTQGRVLVRVSMEGERDDIRFHFAKAFRHLKRTERDMVRKITDKLTTQINVTLSRETLRGLLGGGSMAAQVTSLWKKRTSSMPTNAVTRAQMEQVVAPLFEYFDANFAIMKQTLTDATMLAVMTRLWKEVLMTIENLLIPPLSEKPSLQRPLSSKEMEIVYHWLEMLYIFFNAHDKDSGEVLGVPAEVLKSPKWHELQSLNFFYQESTQDLIRESERMAAATAQRAHQALTSGHTRGMSSPAAFGAPSMGSAAAFGSMGTIRRGKSIMMSRNLGTMRKAKEEKRREAQADPSDDIILRILRMRPEAATYLKERHRQKERQAATAAAALIVKNSVNQGWAPGGSFGRNNLPRR